LQGLCQLFRAGPGRLARLLHDTKTPAPCQGGPV
jgi:hypothetical protein